MNIWKKIASFFPSYKSVDELAKAKKDNIVGLAYWIEQHVWYKEDATPAEDWTPDDIPNNKAKADAVFKRKKGDCDCFVVLEKACLDLWGWKNVIIYVCSDYRGKKKDEAHLVLGFTEPGGRKGYLDNGVIKMLARGESWVTAALNVRPWVATYKIYGDILL